MELLMQILHVAWAVLFTVFFFGACVFVHELGHFLAAKLCGLHIDAFSIGFWKMWERKVGGVAYRIGYLPFGGYCELPQVDSSESEPKSADGKVLRRATPLERIITAVAGPLFNIIFGLMLGCLVWHYGIPMDSPKMTQIEVLEVVENSPEHRAGLRAGDMITELNGRSFRWTWNEFAKELLFSIGEVDLTTMRDGKEQHAVYTPAVNPGAPGGLKYEKIAWPFFTPKIPLRLYPEKGSAAESVGIIDGDTLESVDGIHFSDYGDLIRYIAYSGEKELLFRVKRGYRYMDFKLVPRAWKNAGGDTETTHMIGIGFDAANPVPAVKEFVEPIKAARQAGLEIGDVITAVNANPINTRGEYFAAVDGNDGKPLHLTVSRGGKTLEFTVTPATLTIMTAGFNPMLYDYPTPFEQFASIVETSYKSLRGMLVSAGNKMKLTEQTSSIQGRHMSGPPGIFLSIYRMVSEVSLMTGIHFVVIICFALAIFNLLPLPVLDGGHITFALVELIIRRPLPPALIRSLSTVFVVLLIALMLYVSYYDVLRMMPPSVREKLDGEAKTVTTENADAATPQK